MAVRAVGGLGVAALLLVAVIKIAGKKK